MKTLPPTFRDDKDKLIILIMFVATLFLCFIPSLIVIFLPKNIISETSCEIAKAIFNFELLLFLIMLITIIPVLGWIFGCIAGPILAIWNAIIVIINICAIAGNKELKIPVFYNFV